MLASLALAPRAGAAPRIAVGPVEGDRAVVIPAQLAGALCGRFECVLWPKVSSGGRVDAAKVRQAGVAGVLVGRLDRSGAGPAAALALVKAPGPWTPDWTFRVGPGGKLAAEDVTRLERALLERLAVRPAAAPVTTAPHPGPLPAEAAGSESKRASPLAPSPRDGERAGGEGPAATSTPRPSPLPADTSGRGTVGPAAAPAPPAPRPSAPPAAPARRVEATPPPPAAPVVAVEAGPFWGRRALGFTRGASMTGTLRSFEAGAIGGVQGGLEVYPLARAGGPAAGLGVEASVATAIGLETEAPGGGARDTTFLLAQAGLAWRSPPLGALRVVVTPSLGWAWQRVKVSPSIDGLADADLAGPRLALRAEGPAGGRLTLRLGLAAAWWTRARQLVDGTPAFFPGGSAWALEGEAGVGVALWGPLSVRAGVTYGATRYTLDPDPTGTYAASAATDEVLTVRAALRASF